MDRPHLIEKCFQQGQRLSLADATYRTSVDEFLRWLVTSDQTNNDLTTKALKLSHRTTAVVQAKQTGTLAGIDEVLFLLKAYPDITVEACAEDGRPVVKGQTVLALSLDIGELLGLERAILNIIGRMSGIATQTQRLVALARQEADLPLIAGTRKTPWMLLDKKAIYLGGGLTHRLSLGDSILVKDNHLAAFRKQSGSPSIEQAIAKAVQMLVQASPPPRDYFELEVETVAQGRAALAAFEAAVRGSSHQPTMIVMLDNFGPAFAGEFIHDVRGSALYDQVLFEASGDITEETIPVWSKTGVDVLSLGALTHSVKTFNISMALR